MDNDVSRPCKPGHVRNSRAYFCYKEYYAINVQAVAGADRSARLARSASHTRASHAHRCLTAAPAVTCREFLYASIRSPGSQPDAAAYPYTSLAQLIASRGGLPAGRWLNADDVRALALLVAAP